MVINHHFKTISITICLSSPVSPTATTKLVFDCSFPVPSESLVLNAIANLLSSRSANIPETAKVLGFYYNSMFSIIMTLLIYKHIILSPFSM